jgi:adenylate kinase
VREELTAIIIVTGTPGTGKTTLARALAEAIEACYLNLTQFVSKYKLYSGIDRQRRTKIIDVSRTRARLKKELSTMRGPVVIDTHVPGGIVPREMVKRVFVLRSDPRTLEDRLRAKKWRANKIRENVLAEIVDSCLNSAVEHYGRRRVIQFDTSHVNIQNCVALMKRAIIRMPGKRVKIDWLAKLEKEKSLERFLK